MGYDNWEYPLWRILRSSGIAQLRIEHVIPHPNMPRPYPLGPFNPTLVIVTAEHRPPEMTIDGNPWYRKLELPSMAVYTKEP